MLRFLVGLLPLLSLPAAAATPMPAPAREERILLRDGTRLAADVWLPSSRGRAPVLLYRTPYGRKAEALEHRRTFLAALARGYAVVVNDVRGRYGSEGRFRPYEHERQDGYDVIEWAARADWSDGRVGMLGLSYPGAVQWLAAVEAPPSLKAIVPAMSFASGRRFFRQGGALDLSWLPWIWRYMAPAERARRNLPGPRTEEEARSAWSALGTEHFTGRLPLAALPELRDVADYWYDWIATPPESPAWDFAELARDYHRVKAAVLNLTGWYDDPSGPDSAIAGFEALRARDVPTSLLIGPWTHGVAAVGTARAGERVFADHAAVDYDGVVLDWLDRHVRGVRRTAEPPVRFFLMGEDRWLTAERWPPPEARVTTLALASPTGAADAVLVSDPTRPVRDREDGFGAYDLSFLSAQAGALTFETSPLPRPLRLAGPVHLELVVTADVPDFDLFARLVDVPPSGPALNVTTAGQGVLRASYRFGLGSAPRPVPVGRPIALRLDRMVTASTLPAGHRLRLVLSGHLAPWFSRNLQTGAPEGASAQARAGTLRIKLGGARGARLRLTTLP